MKAQRILPSAPPLRFFPTDVFAVQAGVSPKAVRKRFCQTGSYWGVVPVKLQSGRLMWPADGIDKLLNVAEPAGA